MSEWADRHRVLSREYSSLPGPWRTDRAPYLREVQDVWTWVRPYFDDRATAAAEQLGLPTRPEKLGALAPRANARLAAALIRVSLDDDVRRQVSG